MWWFWWWMLFVIILLVLPLGYGWGYRDWGPPYPSVYRRSRDRNSPPAVGPAAGNASMANPTGSVSNNPPDLSGWGVGADLLWIFLVLAIVWLLLALFWWA
jgi:hypothetical protein